MWASAWPRADVDAIVALYAPEAVFFSHPFREQQDVRDYVVWAFGDQASAECRFGEPVVDGDRAAVDWWAVMTNRAGEVESIAGTSLLRFAPEGRVSEQRDAWASVPERVDLPLWAR